MEALAVRLVVLTTFTEFTAIPAPIRKAVRAVVPASIVDGTKDYIIRRYYVPGMVSRTGPVMFAFRRYVLRQPPHLHRLLYHVTDHCNLNCKVCTHFSNIAEKHFSDRTKGVLKFLFQLKGRACTPSEET